MIKVLIVDDEIHVVNWLMSLFSSIENLELDLYPAYSGEQAVAVLEKTKVDIVFSDIRMPDFSGFELADMIKEKWPSSRIVFLTGYNDFQYAYRANEYDIISYLLKTEDDEKIIDSLMKAVKSIQEEYHNNLIISRAAANEKMLDYFHEKEFINEILGENYTSDSIKSIAAQAKLQFDMDSPFYLLMANLCETRTKDFDILGVRGLSDIYFSRYVTCCCVKRDSGIIWVVQAKGGTKEETQKNITSFGEILETFLTVILETMKLGFFMMWHPEKAYLPLLGAQIKKLKPILDEQARLAKCEPAVFVLDMNKQKDFYLNTFKYSDNDHKNSLMILENSLLLGNKNTFEQNFKELVNMIPMHQNMRTLHSVELFQRIAVIFLGFIGKIKDYEAKNVFEGDVTKLYSPEKFLSWGEAVDFFEMLAEKILDESKHKSEDNQNMLIQKICSYINENVSLPMSLDTVAKRVNYNASYVSRIFRQNTGQALSDYINKVKMSTAREMLLNTDLSIQDIAKHTGFDSSQYFSTVFKKSEGTPPGKYRLKNK